MPPRRGSDVMATYNPSPASLEESRAVIAAIERELSVLQSEKATNDAALRNALQQRAQMQAQARAQARPGASPSGPSLAIGPSSSVTTVGSRSVSPLRGAARSAWEASIIADEMAQPLRISATAMQKFAAQEAVAEQRLAREFEVHQTQVQRLRDKLVERSAHAERMDAYSHLKRNTNAGMARLSSTEVQGPDEATAGLRPKPSTGSVGGRTGAVVSANLSRLDALERRIAELESGLTATGVYSTAAGLGMVDEGMAYDEGADDATFITQSTHIDSARPSARLNATSPPHAGGSGPAAGASPLTPTQASFQQMHDGAPMGVGILASMSRGRLGGGASRVTSPYLPPISASGGRSASASRGMPAVAAAPLFGLMFKREMTRSSPADAGSVVYAVSRVTTPWDNLMPPGFGAGPSVAPSASQWDVGVTVSRQASRATLGTAATSVAGGGESGDPIERWLAAKRAHTAAAHAAAQPAAPPPQKTAPTPAVSSGSGMAAVRAARGGKAALAATAPPRAGASVGAQPRSVMHAIHETRGRSVTRKPVRTRTNAGTTSATVRTGARANVRNTAMAQFTDIRKRFEEKQKEVHTDLRAPAPTTTVRAAPAPKPTIRAAAAATMPPAASRVRSQPPRTDMRNTTGPPARGKAATQPLRAASTSRVAGTSSPKPPPAAAKPAAAPAAASSKFAVSKLGAGGPTHGRAAVRAQPRLGVRGGAATMPAKPTRLPPIQGSAVRR